MTSSQLLAGLISDAVSAVAGGNLNGNLGSGTGIGMLNSLMFNIFITIRSIITIVALYAFTRSGLKLINSADEDKLKKAKTVMASTTVAVMLAYLVPSLVIGFYGDGNSVTSEGGTVLESNVFAGACLITTEIIGVINWVLVLVPAAALFIVVSSGLLAIASFGGEDGVTKMRRSVVGVVVGLLLIGSTGAIMATFGLGTCTAPGAPSAAPLFIRGLYVLNSLLAYLLWGAAIMAVIAGLMMILNLGNDDQYGKAKNLLLRIVVGLAIVFISWVGVQFIMYLVLG